MVKSVETARRRGQVNADAAHKDGDDETKKRYHDTLITNAQSLCGMLTHLNVAGDPKLEQARRELERTMAGADIETIKESATERADIKGKVDAILKQYDW